MRLPRVCPTTVAEWTFVHSTQDVRIGRHEAQRSWAGESDRRPVLGPFRVSAVINYVPYR